MYQGVHLDLEMFMPPDSFDKCGQDQRKRNRVKYGWVEKMQMPGMTLALNSFNPGGQYPNVYHICRIPNETGDTCPSEISRFKEAAVKAAPIFHSKYEKKRAYEFMQTLPLGGAGTIPKACLHILFAEMAGDKRAPDDKEQKEAVARVQEIMARGEGFEAVVADLRGLGYGPKHDERMQVFWDELKEMFSEMGDLDATNDRRHESSTSVAEGRSYQPKFISIRQLRQDAVHRLIQRKCPDYKPEAQPGTTEEQLERCVETLNKDFGVRVPSQTHIANMFSPNHPNYRASSRYKEKFNVRRTMQSRDMRTPNTDSYYCGAQIK